MVAQREAFPSTLNVPRPRGEANVLLEATPRNSDALVVQW